MNKPSFIKKKSIFPDLQEINRIPNFDPSNNVELKNMILKIGSIPIKNEKREQLYKNLKDNAIINKAIDDKMNLLNYLNTNVKIGVAYGLCYFSALKS